MTELERKLLITCANALAHVSESDVGRDAEDGTMFGLIYDEEKFGDVRTALHEYRNDAMFKPKQKPDPVDPLRVLVLRCVLIFVSIYLMVVCIGWLCAL